MEKESWKEIQIEDTGTERDNVLAKVCAMNPLGVKRCFTGCGWRQGWLDQCWGQAPGLQPPW